jgi:hypothetical protein
MAANTSSGWAKCAFARLQKDKRLPQLQQPRRS